MKTIFNSFIVSVLVNNNNNTGSYEKMYLFFNLVISYEFIQFYHKFAEK